MKTKYIDVNVAKSGRGKYCNYTYLYIKGEEIAAFAKHENYTTIILRSGAEIDVKETTDQIIDKMEGTCPKKVTKNIKHDC